MRCPTCKKRLPDDGPPLPSRPFCSDGCRIIDLARWLDGSYVLPGEPVDIEQSFDEESRAERQGHRR